MEFIFLNDPHRMNWFREEFEYAKVICPNEFSAAVETIRGRDTLKTRIIVTNNSEKPYFTEIDTIGIYFPLNDRYDGSKLCITNRCHAHLFCGGDVSYIMALRMGGDAPHLGMVLTEGSISHYSILRDTAKMSNDRGCFVLHPSPMELKEGESVSLEWEIFSHTGKEDFYNQLRQYKKFVDVRAEKYVMYANETNTISIEPAFKADSVLVNGKAVESDHNNVYKIGYTPDSIGEKVFHIIAGRIHTSLRILVVPQLKAFAKTRCDFIAKAQQYSGKCNHLKNAYLSYDNEEKHIVYRQWNDLNGGRERVGMGMSIIKYLQHFPDMQLENSLDRYIEFVKRELVDTVSGNVFNDICYDASYERLYNHPWYAALFTELYYLKKDKKNLEYAVNIMKVFYKNGGSHFYAIEVPILLLCEALEQEHMTAEKDDMTALFQIHADKIAEIGMEYPAHEVNYEQSIVAPAADILLETYLLTGKDKYFEAGKQQLAVLELFNGLQPDYHLYETAIRHWDGYWFGKRNCYGDTFPHYWSALTGNVYFLYWRITGDEAYRKKADASFRSVLSLIHHDGTASCAYVYPYSVNGVKTDFADPMANDQDWGLYFMLRNTL